MHRHPRLLTLALASLALACGAGGARAPGDVDVVVLARAAPDEPVPMFAFVHLTGVTEDGAAYDRWVPCVQEPEHLEAELDGVPPGSYRATGRAFAAAPADPAVDAPDYESTFDAALVITPGCTRLSVLVLDRVGAQEPAGTNHAPRVHAVVASTPTVDPSAGDAVALSVVAVDPDGPEDLASITWSESFVPTEPAATPAATSGGFTSTTGSSTAWSPAGTAEGTALLTVTATDQSGATSSITLAVATTCKSTTGTVNVTAQLNGWPEIRSIRATAAQLAPGASTTLTVTAVDADLDPLAYGWSDGGCGGRFASPAAASTAWTAPSAPATCTLRVTVRDLKKGTTTPRGGQVVGSLTVAVSSPPPVLAPRFVSAWTAPPSPFAAGTLVSFAVKPVESSGAAVTRITWSDGAGGTFTPAVAGDPSWVRWTAPSCVAGAKTRNLTVTATAVGAADSPTTPARATFPFPVTVTCP